MADSLVIIPTYNEKENIVRMIETVLSLDAPFHLLIVDDGSPDGTAALVKALQAQFPDRLFLLERSGKLGLGTAYITAFRWGLERGYEFFLKWMPTSRTIPTICCGCTRLAKKTAPICR
ncbi:MAG TPA: glycosyltransferase [Saprospiraceae bacterium]|nr:glycosyltransferase [Saprospiraceae bacterium]